MDAFTWMAILSTISAGSSVYAGQQESEANKAQARESERVGAERMKVEKERGKRMRSTQKSAFETGGVSSNYGTPQQIMLETLATSVREQEAILAGAKAESSAYRKRAKIAKISAVGEAVSSFTPLAGMGI